MKTFNLSRKMKHEVSWSGHMTRIDLGVGILKTGPPVPEEGRAVVIDKRGLPYISRDTRSLIVRKSRESCENLRTQTSKAEKRKLRVDGKAGKGRKREKRLKASSLGGKVEKSETRKSI